LAWTFEPALELYLRERHRVTLTDLPEEYSDDKLIPYLDSVQNAVRDHRWSVTPSVWLSTFSFESLAIYYDLKAMADVAVTYPVGQALAPVRVTEAGSDEIIGSLDKLPSPDIVPIPVLPADCSQLEALTYGAAGASVRDHLFFSGVTGDLA
jgi:hypothetical protein